MAVSRSLIDQFDKVFRKFFFLSVDFVETLEFIQHQYFRW